MAVKKEIVKKTVKKEVLRPVKKVVSKPIKKEIKEETVKQTGLSLSVFDLKGKEVEKVSLPKEIFGVKVNKRLITQAVRVYLANQRQGTVSTKTRGEVVASKRKIYKQKGTGRARHGANSAPIFVGGGLVFGPKPRDYSLKLTKKMKKNALFSSLTLRKENGDISVVSGLEKVEPKTKIINASIKALNIPSKARKILLVTSDSYANLENTYRAARNLEGVKIMSANMLNTYEVLNAKNILFMKQAIDSLEKTFLKKEDK